MHGRGRRGESKARLAIAERCPPTPRHSRQLRVRGVPGSEHRARNLDLIVWEHLIAELRSNLDRFTMDDAADFNPPFSPAVREPAGQGNRLRHGRPRPQLVRAGAFDEAGDKVAQRDRHVDDVAVPELLRPTSCGGHAFPTTLLPARPIGDDADVELNGKRVATFSTYLHNTRPMATAGIPGLSLPIGLTAAGLPSGLEFDAPEGQDRALLSFALAVEALFPPIPSPY